MSHFTRVKTQLTDAVALKSALKDLGHPFEEGGRVRGWVGRTLHADIVVKLPGSYDIGFERAGDGSYQAVADWSELRMSEKAFLQPITQRYAYHKVVAEVAKQGFQVVQETVAADQTVKITVRRWA